MSHAEAVVPMLHLRDLGQLHEMTVEEYLESNIGGRTELLGGIVYDVSPRNEPHRHAVRQLSLRLTDGRSRISETVGLAVIVQAQDALAVPDWNGKDAPEIDVAVIADRFYRPIPTTADAFALIEVSDTTYRCDRDYKIPLYVAAGVPAWIVNIPERWVEFYGCADDLKRRNGHVFRDSVAILDVTIGIASLFESSEAK